MGLVGSLSRTYIKKFDQYFDFCFTSSSVDEFFKTSMYSVVFDSNYQSIFVCFLILS